MVRFFVSSEYHHKLYRVFLKEVPISVTYNYLTTKYTSLYLVCLSSAMLEDYDAPGANIMRQQ
jgi:hypothetical protein